MTQSEIRTTIKNLINSHFEQSTAYKFDSASPRVRLHEPTFDGEEVWEALDSLLTTQITMGKKVRRFEQEFSEYFKFANSTMVNSGSSANLIATAALTNIKTKDGLKPGDEIIVPALAWSTTIWPLIQHGLVPVIVDINPLSMNLDPNEVERAIGNKTRGIMLVHVYGNPCDMTAIQDIVKRHSLILIEDCCEALGASYDNEPVGSFGQVGTFSFYFSHHITTLEGGMCVTNDGDLADMMRILRAHGWVREVANPDKHLTISPDIDPRFLFVNLGYNLRATELQGGFGYTQLRKLDRFLAIRTSNAHYWKNELSKLNEFFGFQQENPRGRHSWFGFPMTVRTTAPFTVKDVRRFLNDRGIETRPIIAGNIAEQPAMKLYEHRVSGSLSNSSHIMNNGFTFGNHQGIENAAREYVASTLYDFAAEHALC